MYLLRAFRVPGTFVGGTGALVNQTTQILAYCCLYWNSLLQEFQELLHYYRNYYPVS